MSSESFFSAIAILCFDIKVALTGAFRTKKIGKPLRSHTPQLPLAKGEWESFPLSSSP
nr:hypothetical protein [Gilliamella apicola]